MKAKEAYKVPVVVVGSGLNALGVIRSLGRAGVPVTVLASDPEGPAMHTRYARRVACRSTVSDSVIEALVGLGHAFESRGVCPVLFLTQEDTVAVVSRRRDELAPFYRVTLPASRVLMQLMHKDGFRAVAVASGVTVPRTLRITDAEEIGSLAELQPPLIVKPSFRDPAYASAFQKAYCLDRIDEAQALVRQMLGVLPDVVAQEWIEGGDSDIYFCLQYIRRDGEPAASFVGRKLRSWPPKVGGTASCTVAPDALQLSQTTTQFFREAGVVGLASMEYKRDARSGRFFMVEPTVGRTDYQEEVATLNGTNIPLAAYRTELGLSPCLTTEQARPCIWRDRTADRQSVMQTGQLNIKSLTAGARVVDALWRPYDPMPAVVLLRRRIYARLRRTVTGSTVAGKHMKGPAGC